MKGPLPTSKEMTDLVQAAAYAIIAKRLHKPREESECMLILATRSAILQRKYPHLNLRGPRFRDMILEEAQKMATNIMNREMN